MLYQVIFRLRALGYQTLAPASGVSDEVTPEMKSTTYRQHTVLGVLQMVETSETVISVLSQSVCF